MPKINSRAKGHSYELKIINFFKSLGWESCVSSRSESKRLDDAKVDICYSTPFFVQCKAVERFSAYHETLASMPDSKKHMNVVFHKKNRKGTVVAMELETFEKLVKMLIESGQIKPEC